jgi:hypothetical protein
MLLLFGEQGRYSAGKKALSKRGRFLRMLANKAELFGATDKFFTSSDRICFRGCTGRRFAERSSTA